MVRTWGNEKGGVVAIVGRLKKTDSAPTMGTTLSHPVHSLYILLIEESNPFASSCTAVDAAAARKDTDGGECGTAIGNV